MPASELTHPLRQQQGSAELLSVSVQILVSYVIMYTPALPLPSCFAPGAYRAVVYDVESFPPPLRLLFSFYLHLIQCGRRRAPTNTKDKTCFKHP